MKLNSTIYIPTHKFGATLRMLTGSTVLRASDRLFERTRAGDDQAVALKVGCSPAGFLHGG